MTPGAGTGAPERAAYLAAVAAAIGQPEWRADAARIAGADPPPPPAPPTYRDLALAGTDLVEALAAQGRWDEAGIQARHLTRYFTSVRAELHAVAGEAFNGLYAAVLARDPEEIDDFLSLLREIFR